MGGRGEGFPTAIGGTLSPPMRAQVSGPPSRNGSRPAALLALDITMRHGAPGLLVLAGALGGLRAWASLKRSLPLARVPALARSRV